MLRLASLWFRMDQVRPWGTEMQESHQLQHNDNRRCPDVTQKMSVKQEMAGNQTILMLFWRNHQPAQFYFTHCQRIPTSDFSKRSFINKDKSLFSFMKWYNNLIFVTHSVTMITFYELSIQYARIYIMSWTKG